MFTLFLALGIAAAIGYRLATPSELTVLEQKLRPLLAVRQRWLACTEPFRHALRERTPRLIVTPVLVVVNTAVFLRLVVADTTLSEATLVTWGASQATPVAQGEWWRLVTATFLHGGFFSFIVTTIGLVQVGALLERLIGRATVACAYVSSAAFVHAVTMSTDVTSAYAGGAAAIIGLYGVLFAAWSRGVLRRGAIIIPRAQYQLLAPGAALLGLSSLATYGFDGVPYVAALSVGVLIGFSGAIHADSTRSTLAPVAVATAIALAAIIFVALPVRAQVDVREQLVRVVTIENQTADRYREVLRQFTDRRKRVEPAPLTALIDDVIVPQLSRTAADIAALETVPQQQALVATAMEYLRLRQASWRLRADGLRKGDIRLLQQADKMEQESLEALEPLERLRSEGTRPHNELVEG